MKKFWKIISVVLLLSLVFVTPAFADSGDTWTPVCDDSFYSNDCTNDWIKTKYTITGNRDLATVTIGPVTVNYPSNNHSATVHITYGELLDCGEYSAGNDSILNSTIYLGTILAGETKSFNFDIPDGKDVAYIYLAQTSCANCLSYIKVKFKTDCDWGYELKGTTHNCYLNKNFNIPVPDTKSKLPLRYDGTDYMFDLCVWNIPDCDGNIIKTVPFNWVDEEWSTYCKPLPPCVDC